ncbi:MAG: group 1 truncated hemoglobin [Nevskia sp.]|nr:group 1 truncated hemoglobin [Nevskia sp.]
MDKAPKSAPASAGEDRKLYESIGGATGVNALVERFYANVLNDPQLAPFFEHARMDRLRRMQREFFAAALGGPVDYSGDHIAHAHHGRGIGRAEFQRFVQHLFDTLAEFRLTENERYAIIERINRYVNEVTGAPAGT